MKYEGTDIGRPVDRTAARVMGKGFQYVNPKRIACVHSETPLATIPIEWNEKDLSGVKFASFTVIGKHKKPTKSSSRGAIWAVRCNCGRYTTRRSKSINHPDPIDCCEECRQLQFIKRADEYNRYGRNFDKAPAKPVRGE